jgi:hypothetical protein
MNSTLRFLFFFSSFFFERNSILDLCILTESSFLTLLSISWSRVSSYSLSVAVYMHVSQGMPWKLNREKRGSYWTWWASMRRRGSTEQSHGILWKREPKKAFRLFFHSWLTLSYSWLESRECDSCVKVVSFFVLHSLSLPNLIWLKCQALSTKTFSVIVSCLSRWKKVSLAEDDFDVFDGWLGGWLLCPLSTGCCGHTTSWQKLQWMAILEQISVDIFWLIDRYCVLCQERKKVRHRDAEQANNRCSFICSRNDWRCMKEMRWSVL